MRNPTILLLTDRPDAVLETLGELHPDLRPHVCDTYAGLSEKLADTKAEVVYSILLSGQAKFPKDVLMQAQSVQWISVGGSGIDHLGYWDPGKIMVTNSRGLAAGMMAEYALGTILSFSLRLRHLGRLQIARQWSVGRVEPIEGKTILIVGVGGAGRAVAARAKALGMHTLGIRARPIPIADVDEVHAPASICDVVGRADYIVCCVPLLPATRGLIGSDAFSAMKPSAFLVNMSRGGVVDEKALVDALDRGLIGGAALDVFDVEPLPPDHVLWGYENVVITPHCASAYPDWERDSARMFCDNLTRWRNGEALVNVVYPDRGY
ncbi:D-2-hydroxyacid dehydrogenase [Mesorhizobium sp. M3A.F.Ca.ET.080.04.2.1]|uniref:D-2-hydroxyacid dehydrogenase n=1 Tax=Mesorhizobium sp. M3A.F.Ca.ET.080.04.2.1 TaxID=2493676 RepID=UPI000F75A740|nr:D-2-hydroxyacid dehydrogenase [Mesorhizobium sp. M3A.F.Ca.ET.080.04.2.1]AZO07939.1 D-2-hydroxyacid dehydrogenase [Mesorhizobium sp. M3A.F.Ca.ET.080.04.2.1]RWF18409.1 MAG: D-2-hydroxyacid dehydrogenase [Mesorhizobium sp.]